MTRNEAIKAIVHLETTAEYYCAEGSKRQRDYLADAHQLRMHQEPPETRKLNQLQSVLRYRQA
tara:strand:+ start:1312 stop:1500 length:189 start_codon:yes stop_codon:yes gene_type:complete